MSYIVVYQSEDGSPGVEECVDLDLAIVTAERLRNVDAVDRPRIFKTEEIRYDFKPYYRVEVSSIDDEVAAPEVVEAPAEDTSVASVTPIDSTIPAVVAEPVAPAVEEPAPVVETETPFSDPFAGTAPTHDVFGESAPDLSPEVEELTPPEVPTRDLFEAGMDTGASPDLADLVDDAAPELDVEPPRRGLFGR